MPTIAATVFDVVAALPGPGCSMREVIKAFPDVEQAKVTSAVHRLKDLGVLRIHHELAAGFIYSIAPGAARPTDGRGRPRKREEPTRCFESSPATLRNAASR
jgi:hypothetical protein